MPFENKKSFIDNDDKFKNKKFEKPTAMFKFFF
jgi:hypothetical protein